MKRLHYFRYFFTGFFLSTIFISSAFGEYQKGILILNSGDSIECMIKVHKKDIFVNGYRITYKENGKKKKIDPNDAFMIKFDSISYEKLVIDTKRQVQHGPRKVWEDYQDVFFARLLQNGNTRLFVRFKKIRNIPIRNEYVPLTSGFGSVIYEDHYIKRDNYLKYIDDLNFKKRCLTIFSDCPEMIEKLNNREFRYKDIETMVKYANEHCSF